MDARQCELCEEWYTPKAGTQKYCPECSYIVKHAHNRLNGMEPTHLGSFYEDENERRKRMGRPIVIGWLEE